jgi:copper chaperone
METLKFKTNIKCGGCIATVTPALNTLAGLAKWEVDTTNPEKILTVESNGALAANDVISVLRAKGYDAEKI